MLLSISAKIAFAVIMALLLLSGLKAADIPNGTNADKCDLTAINLLADLIDTIMAYNADYRQISDSLNDLEPAQRDSALARLAQKNAADPAINTAIENLLHSPAYRLYYRQYKYIDSSVHKKVFYALPYQAISSAGDISTTFYELCRHHDKFQAWIA